MLYFYSCIVKKEGEEFLVDGSIECKKEISTQEEFSRFQKEIKEDIIKHLLHNSGDTSNITFQSFNRL